MFTKKRLIIIITTVFIGVFGSFGFIRLNNFLEWQIAVEAAGALPRQLGITQATLSQCVPSCQTPAGVATCCISVTGVGGMCPFFTPGSWGTYDTGCPLFSSVTGVQAGGMGNMALLSNVAIAKAGLVNGGQLIYGGTTENMSMTAGGANTVLASVGGCYGCEMMAQGEPEWKQKLAMLGKVIVAMFRE